MMIFVDQTYITVLPIRQFMQTNKFGECLICYRNLLQEGANMQNANALKELSPIFFLQKLMMKKWEFNKSKKHHVESIKKILTLCFLFC